MEQLPSPGPRSRLVVFLTSPGFVVAVAFLVRFVALSFYYQVRNAGVVRLPTIGVEAGKVAYSIATGKGFSGLWIGLDGPTAWIPPVYPYLLAGVFKICSMNEGIARVVVQAMNLMFSAITCWPIYKIGERIFDRRIGLAAAWVWVFLPMAIQMPLEWIWDQSLGALLVCLLLWATLYLRENSAPLAWAGYGVFWALAALTNPAIAVLFPFFSGWLVFQRQKNNLLSRHLVERAVLFLVLALLPWTIRNYQVMRAFVPIKTNFGLELWLGNNPAVKQIWSPELHPQSNPAELKLLMEVGEIRYNRVKQDEALRFILKNPGIFLGHTVERFLDTWTSWYEVDSEIWVRALHIVWEYVLLYSVFSLLALAGLGLALRAHNAESNLLFFCVLFYPMIYYITHSNAHYRHVIDPVLTILGVYALCHLLRTLTADSRTASRYAS